MIKLGGKDWFYRMVKNEGKYTMFDKYPEDTLEDKLVVSLQRTMNGNLTRLFTVFESYTEFANYQSRVPPENRCFYELILAAQHQKPHFDLDMNLKDNSDGDIDNVISHVVDGIFKVAIGMGKHLDPRRDVIVCTSHGGDKRSAHIVIDRYCHRSNEEAGEFYRMVISHVPSELHKFVDDSVYSTRQQFRMLGSQKTGSGRVKTFCKEWHYHGKLIVHNTRDVPRSINRDMVFLSRSLVTMTYGCKMLLVIVAKPARKTFSSEDLTKDEIETATKIVKDHINNFDSTFTIRGVKGRMILLRKLCPYECKVCHRHHDNENPLIIVREDGRIDFYCRRGRASVNIASMEVHQRYVPHIPAKRSPAMRHDLTITRDPFSDISKRSMNVAQDPQFNMLDIQRYLLS